MSTVSVHSQVISPGRSNFTEDWTLPKTLTLVYESQLSGKDAAEEAFMITNAPEEALTEAQAKIAQTRNGHAISVGDVVQVQDDGKTAQYLCASHGWEEKIPEIPLPLYNTAKGSLKIDSSERTLQEAKEIEAALLPRLEKGETIHLQEEYSTKGYGDIPLYLAFQSLIENGKAKGIPPYALDFTGEKIHNDHLSMILEPVFLKKEKAPAPRKAPTPGPDMGMD